MKSWPWYGYIVVGVIILALAYFLYFQPKNTELANLRAERESVEQEVNQLRIMKQQMDKIEKELTSLNQTLKELEVIIPLHKEIDVILRRIQQIAYDSRLDIMKFAPQGEINREFFSEWPIPIEITGNYHNLAIFFDRLSTFSRLFNVEKFKIKALSPQSEDQTISSEFTAKTYMFLEESAQPLPGQKPTGKIQ